MTHALLVGNPNCGKTTLFNALTGENQRVGNWPGVTVEKKTGFMQLTSKTFQVTDLPGIYSLVSILPAASLDEQIAARALISTDFDLIINVIDACHLERHLYLTSQLMELGKPMLVVLNMMDLAKQRGITIDLLALSQQLRCPVLALEAHRKKGLIGLHQALLTSPAPVSFQALSLSSSLQDAVCQQQAHLEQQGVAADFSTYLAHRLLEGDNLLLNELGLSSTDLPLASQDIDILLADARYQRIHQWVIAVQKKSTDAREHFTARMDKVILNRFLALPIFLFVMYGLFFFAIQVGGAFQDFFDQMSELFFVQAPLQLLQQGQMSNGVLALLIHGLGRGLNTLFSFIPVLAAMFFCLTLLESSGYMARVAFVIDRLMRCMGLPGKAFVPLMIGFGCNVPAIQATRTLEFERDRLLTIMMSPFMSCSARLAIYTVFVAAFFPTHGELIVFSLYLLGILMAILTGFCLRKTLLRGPASPLLIELPSYHLPRASSVGREMLWRLKSFLWRAGKIILPVCLVLSALNALSWEGGVHFIQGHEASLLSTIGQFLTPIFSPMGLRQENWPATVGLISGMLAKEVVIASLNALYTDQTSFLLQGSFDVIASLKAALWSIPQHFMTTTAQASFLNQRLLASFNGPVGAYAYLLFILLYLPCVSTMAAIRQEANTYWMAFSIAWSFLLAYALAVLFYQGATLKLHPWQTLSCLVLVLLLFTALIFILGRMAQTRVEGSYALANS